MAPRSIRFEVLLCIVSMPASFLTGACSEGTLVWGLIRHLERIGEEPIGVPGGRV